MFDADEFLKAAKSLAYNPNVSPEIYQALIKQIRQEDKQGPITIDDVMKGLLKNV